MDIGRLLDFMNVAEKLKCNVRHSWTSSGRRESVAEHTYRLCVFAWLVKDEFPDCDMDKVMRMCLFHDIGEAVKGDIPCFEKTDKHRKEEEDGIKEAASVLPECKRQELLDILKELAENQTKEAKIVHALDKMEALIQHNEAPIESWLPLEYELQLTYGNEQAKAFSYLKKLRDKVREDSLVKIEHEGKQTHRDGFYVSRKRNQINVEEAVRLLRQSDWAKDRPKEMIQKAIEHSQCYGVFDSADKMVGFARIMTDYTTTFYLMDVIVDEAYRHQGLGTLLMNAIMEDVGELYGILHTDDAQKFYEKYGFVVNDQQMEQVMEKPR